MKFLLMRGRINKSYGIIALGQVSFIVVIIYTLHSLSLTAHCVCVILSQQSEAAVADVQVTPQENQPCLCLISF